VSNPDRRATPWTRVERHRTACLRVLVQLHQFAKGAVSLSLVVDHPIGDTPAVLATPVDLDFDWLMRRGEGLTQLVLGVRLALIVVGRDGEIVVGPDLGGE
jgi:hypothetical protein